MKSYYLLLILFVFNQANSQDYSVFVSPRSNTVSAQSGLNIRSKPDLNGTKIGVIPFGEKVQYIHRDHYGFQSLDSIKTQKNDYAINGLWLKVKYKNLKGYVLSTFLYYENEFEIENKYSDYVILYPGGGCMDNIHDINAYNWYGLYEVDSLTSLSPIKFDYYNVLNSMLNMLIVAKNDRDLKYIIGAKKKLKLFKNKVANIPDKSWRQKLVDYPCDTTFYLSKNLVVEYEVENKDRNNVASNLYVKKKDGWQKLLPINVTYDIYKYILHQGDIDSDGKDDYIISYGEKPGYTILFLSSESEDGDALKDVACYYSTYCC